MHGIIRNVGYLDCDDAVIWMCHVKPMKIAFLRGKLLSQTWGG